MSSVFTNCLACVCVLLCFLKNYLKSSNLFNVMKRWREGCGAAVSLFSMIIPCLCDFRAGRHKILIVFIYGLTIFYNHYVLNICCSLLKMNCFWFYWFLAVWTKRCCHLIFFSLIARFWHYELLCLRLLATLGTLGMLLITWWMENP